MLRVTKRLSDTTLHFLNHRFGRCARCMRLAMLSFLLAVLGYSAVAIVGVSPWLQNTLLTLTLLSGALTGLHIFLVAWRVSHPSKTALPPSRKSSSGPVAPIPVAQTGYSRRDVTRLFFKTAALTALATLPLATRARASCGDCSATYGSGYYDCITNFCSTIGQVCCPPGSPYLNHCDCLCYDNTSEINCSSYSNCLYCG